MFWATLLKEICQALYPNGFTMRAVQSFLSLRIKGLAEIVSDAKMTKQISGVFAAEPCFATKKWRVICLCNVFAATLQLRELVYHFGLFVSSLGINHFFCVCSIASVHFLHYYLSHSETKSNNGSPCGCNMK